MKNILECCGEEYVFEDNINVSFIDFIEDVFRDYFGILKKKKFKKTIIKNITATQDSPGVEFATSVFNNKIFCPETYKHIVCEYESTSYKTIFDITFRFNGPGEISICDSKIMFSCFNRKIETIEPYEFLGGYKYIEDLIPANILYDLLSSDKFDGSQEELDDCISKVCSSCYIAKLLQKEILSHGEDDGDTIVRLENNLERFKTFVKDKLNTDSISNVEINSSLLEFIITSPFREQILLTYLSAIKDKKNLRCLNDIVCSSNITEPVINSLLDMTYISDECLNILTRFGIEDTKDIEDGVSPILEKVLTNYTIDRLDLDTLRGIAFLDSKTIDELLKKYNNITISDIVKMLDE